jgi:hypothetical protein
VEEPHPESGIEDSGTKSSILFLLSTKVGKQRIRRKREYFLRAISSINFG